MTPAALAGHTPENNVSASEDAWGDVGRRKPGEPRG